MDGVAQLQEHRVALTGHCYRMLGSAFDADDAVQETMVRAWKSMDRFDGRASLRTWLYRIATNVCLDALSSRKARARPMEEGPAGGLDDELTQKPRTHWLEPIPDVVAIPDDVDPAEKLILKQSIRLAFVAALQHLPAKQRAALLLTEVLGFSASEVAEALETTVASVNSALQRARATLAERKIDDAKPLGATQAELLERYVHAFERFEVDELAALLRDDAIFNMPPFDLWLQGPASVRGWLRGRGAGCRGSRLLPVRACGMPAFAQWRVGPGGHFPWGIIVLELAADRIAGWTTFLDVEKLFPLFGLPATPPSA